MRETAGMAKDCGVVNPSSLPRREMVLIADIINLMF
jgi:hypothetical protein